MFMTWTARIERASSTGGLQARGIDASLLLEHVLGELGGQG